MDDFKNALFLSVFYLPSLGNDFNIVICSFLDAMDLWLIGNLEVTAFIDAAAVQG